MKRPSRSPRSARPSGPRGRRVPPSGSPLSPARAARVVGVSESTLKRWVDAGHLRAERTAGGHRRIAPAELVAFLRGRGRPVPSLTALGLLGGARRAVAPAARPSPESLGDLLLDGDMAGARRVLVEAFAAGQPLDALGDQLVAPLMARVGALWAEGRIHVYQEHLATQRLWALLLELRNLLPVPGPEMPLAVGGAPDGDPYVLPSLVAELTLHDLGWRVLNLGPETPVGTLAAAVEEHRPRLVWLSITTPHLSPAFLAEYPRLVAATRAHRAGLIVGGQGLTPELQHRLVAGAFGSRLAHLKEFARTL